MLTGCSVNFNEVIRARTTFLIVSWTKLFIAMGCSLTITVMVDEVVSMISPVGDMLSNYC